MAGAVSRPEGYTGRRPTPDRPTAATRELMDFRRLLARILFPGSIVLICAGLLEFGGWVALYAADGEWIPGQELHRRLAEAYALPGPGDDDPDRDTATAPDTFVLHPYIGFVFNPGSTIIGSADGVRIEGTINRYGFLGDVPPAAPGVRDVNIALFGGSVAVELFTLGSETLIGELRKSPQFSGKQIRLLSIAVNGMKQPQQVMALNYFLSMGKRFDIVVNLDGFNEVALSLSENLEQRISPYYPAKWKNFSTRLGAGPALLRARILDNDAARKRLARVVIRRPLRNSWFVLAVWNLLDNRYLLRRAELAERIRETDAGTGELPAAVSGPPYPRASLDEFFTDAAALWRQASLQMWQLSRANGIAYVHVLQPNQYVEGSKTMTDWERENTVMGPNHAYRLGVEKGYPRLIEAGASLRERGVPFLDLTDAFRGETGTIYRDTCCHFNERGYRIVARKIAEYLINRPAPAATAP